MQKTDYTPIWLMRQAGRYMPEYRKLRERHSIMEIYKTPELSAQVAALPVEQFGVDAAILFADLMTPMEPAGVEFELVENVGPVVRDPIANAGDVARIRESVSGELGFVAEAMDVLKGKVGVPVIGFAGGPFTIACYLIEGRRSEGLEGTRRLMREKPEVWDALMRKLSIIVTDYMMMQAGAGADALQLFDTWSGMLGRESYRRQVMPYTRGIFEELKRRGVKVPLIHFSLDSGAMAGDIASTGCDVVSVGSMNDINSAWSGMGFRKAIQGNLDPAILEKGGQRMRTAAKRILDSVNGRPGHIFNLGHGILPGTKPENVRELVELVNSNHRDCI